MTRRQSLNRGGRVDSANEAGSAATAPGVRPLLDIRDVEVRMGRRAILNDINLSVGDGDFIGLIGANGAGKTTLMRAILGDITPSRGDIRILGQHRARMGMIGYVPQKIELEADLPIRAKDLVALGLDGQRVGFGMRGASFWKQVDHAMRGVGAGDFADRPVGRLSGGQQQRVLIAAAIVANPRLLLLDEPLANLDPANTDDIIALLDSIRRERGISIILSAHDINPLLGVLDHVVYLAEGRSAIGATDEVIRSDTLSRLYRHHIEVLHVDGRVMVMTGQNSHAHAGDERRTVPGRGEGADDAG
jgi:zinc/manganese transport system ATP-binding protein